MATALQENHGTKRRRYSRPAPPGLLVELLKSTGVIVNNGGGHSDIQVRDPETYRRILTRGSPRCGEAYRDELWDCEPLDGMMTRLLRAGIEERFRSLPRTHFMGRFRPLGHGCATTTAGASTGRGNITCTPVPRRSGPGARSSGRSH
jgi:hypothetical protein